jgi:diguanylate cyclase
VVPFGNSISRGQALSKRQRILAVLVGIGTGVLAVLLGLSGSIEANLRQARDSLHRTEASGDVVIAEIDARSLAAIDQWPWQRSTHAQLIDRLAGVKARSIAFDVDFSTRSSPKEDDAFSAALKRAGGAVILPTFRQSQGGGNKAVFENLPIPGFRENAFLASVNIQPDHDGLVRRYEIGVVTGKTMRPSIAAMLTETSSSGSKSLTIDNSIDPASIPRVSYVDVLEGRVPADKLANKRILVGATAIEMGDRYAIPLHGVIPGVVIQAMAAETLMQGGTGVDIGPWPLLGIALLGLWLSARAQSDAARASFLAAAVALVIALPLLLELLKLGTIESGPALLALLSGAACIAIELINNAFWDRKTKDSATGLPNAFEFNLDAKRHGKYIAVAARILHYNEISVLLGPEQTAEWLRRIADRLALAAEHKTIYRAEDNGLIWIFDAAEEDTLAERFTALDHVFRAPITIGARSLENSISYGVSKANDADPQTRCAQALLAADRAAEQGFRWDLHTDDHGADLDWKMSLLGELDLALQNGEIFVVYQPKADIASGEILGAEALVRWRHPERGLIAPDHFIPVIEKEGRMIDLTLFVVRQALGSLERLARQGFDGAIAVNVSAPLLGDAAFTAGVSQLISASPIDPSCLIFEVTESATLADPDRAVAAMEAMRKLGVGLSIDDYGTGQSTLTYLKRLPATEIKIDKSFVTDLVNSRHDQILVRSTIALAHELGFKVVAEGIETAECLKLLESLGCDVGQGWHIGKPMSMTEFAAIVEKPLDIAA